VQIAVDAELPSAAVMYGFAFFQSRVATKITVATAMTPKRDPTLDQHATLSSGHNAAFDGPLFCML
jgi:hypothetical protein